MRIEQTVDEENRVEEEEVHELREGEMKGGVFVQKAVCSEGDSQVIKREREREEKQQSEKERIEEEMS